MRPRAAGGRRPLDLVTFTQDRLLDAVERDLEDALHAGDTFRPDRPRGRHPRIVREVDEIIAKANERVRALRASGELPPAFFAE